MNSKIKKRLNLSAKIVTIFYIVLITMFAFDVRIFSIGFLVHLIPTIIFFGCFFIVWFNPKMGGILFVILGISTVLFFRTYNNFLSIITISLVPIVVGILFILSHKKH